MLNTFAQRLCAFLLASLLLAAQEPVKPKLTPTIITATKQVTLFTGLEKQMLQAIEKKDRTSLNALLTDEFEIAQPDADPLAGDDWTESVMGNDFKLKAFLVRQVSVADLGDWAVVKFDRLQQATYQGKDASGEFFVVDLWRKSGDGWRLANRYVAKVGPIPENFQIQKRPSGKQ
jgi:Domain of unknown function (DUF4440)